MDKLSPEKRSWNMSRIKSQNTKPELQLRKVLHDMGFRYRLHDKKLPGSPDLVFPKYKAVIFVHGCFWHRHGCKQTTTPATRKDFWKAKFKTNTKRDKKNIQELQNAGWRVMVVWECELKNSDKNNLYETVQRFLLKKNNIETRIVSSGEVANYELGK